MEAGPPGAITFTAVLRRRLVREAPAVSYSIPPPKHPHTWAELLTLVDAIRRIAYNITLEADDAMRRIRAYDGA
jgi:hypothetical protein